MKLNYLLKGINKIKKSDFNPDITYLTCDTKKIIKNCVFVCLKGVNFDGHDFAKKAIDLGACAIVVEKDLDLANQILVEDSHKAFAKMCANFYNNPSEKLKFIGVTGTNGKTSTTKIIKEILTSQGKNVGLIGTIQNEIGSEIIETKNTTPNHLEFQELLHKMVLKHCDYVIMEVSSHALVQERIGNTKFSIAIFTNLSQDHLDYHKTMEEYFKAKKKLFQKCEKALVCLDDVYGERLINEINCPTYSYAIGNENATFLAKDIDINCDGVRYILEAKEIREKIKFNTPGIFSVYNSMAAYICCLLLGIPHEKISNALKYCNSIKGRSEKLKTNTNFTVICDYAHSPDGLQNILASINSYKKTRVITLFGCGGDRDKTKRDKMGEIAAKHSDFLIVTSDNPRTEDPQKIIDDILVGVRRTETPYVKILNRKKAIYYALKIAKKDDIILLAGKGHETYQIIGTQKRDFDERAIVKKALEELQIENPQEKEIEIEN